MKEIKFRYVLRDKETKAISTMHYTLEEIEAGSIHTDFAVLGLIDRTKYDVVARLQYSGMKDTNGVEIYEGDIVLVAGLGVVEVKITPDYGVIYENPELFCDNSYSDSAMEGDFPEILGNIYENPELLNGRIRRE